MNQEAVYWLERLERGDCSDQDYREFDSWIAACDANARAFEEAKMIAARVDAIAYTPTMQRLACDVMSRSGYPHAERTNNHQAPSWLQKLMGSVTGPAFTGVLASTVFLLLGSLWWFAPAAKVHSTKVGEQRVVVLPDNSRVTLDTNSALRLEFSEYERRVYVTRGRAFFDVSHDYSRPFVVSVAANEIRALGTAFSVYRRDDWLRVTLSEGSVQVSALGKGGAEKVVMSPGEQVIYSPVKGMERESLSDIQKRMSWLDGRLVFTSTPLSEVVAQVNRYSDNTIRLTNPSLYDIEIDAVFKVGDVDTFLLVLQSSFGLTAMRRLNGEIDLIEDARE